MTRHAGALTDTGALLNDYLTEAQFADEMGVTVRTVRSWKAMGEGPAITRIGKRVLYARSDCRAWLRAQRREM